MLMDCTKGANVYDLRLFLFPNINLARSNHANITEILLTQRNSEVSRLGFNRRFEQHFSYNTTTCQRNVRGKFKVTKFVDGYCAERPSTTTSASWWLRGVTVHIHSAIQWFYQLFSLCQKLIYHLECKVAIHGITVHIWQANAAKFDREKE